MNKKNKKAMEGGMWWIIVGAIAALIVAAIIIFIVKEGLFTAKQNIDILGSCANKGGHCEKVREKAQISTGSGVLKQ